ncbi:MAG: endolytic transglycosylase MltG [Gammaproteobacteria bacterium]|nr:endolytic transglycosylase MltG [Gammaproteobacteria bacterium]
MSLIRKPASLVVVTLLLAGLYLGWSWSRSLIAEDKTVVIQPGTSLGGVSRELVQEDILSNAWSFKFLAYIRGDSRRIKVGEYLFPAGISQWKLLNQIVAGKVVEYPLQFIEGWTFKQLLAALESAPKLTHELTGKKEGEIMALLGYANIHPEGRFYPDTYFYSAGATDISILQRAYKKMEKALWIEWEARDPSVPVKDPYEALILASIIEKETGQPDERSMIAGVFVNRLRKQMRLQTDPTVIYGMGDSYRGNIRLKDLRTDTPYNTYTRGGLPPTPIAMPGQDAIHAALHPRDTKALYFVSRGDGSHVFSDTLSEHNQAVIKYQLGGRPRPTTSTTPDA